MLLRLAPHLAIAVLAGPIAFGLLATILPAFGWFPPLGGHSLSLDPFRVLFAEPGIWRSAAVSLAAGLVTTALSLALVAAFFAAWSGTHLFTRVQHAISPLLSIPHAAAAFGLAFLIAPSGWIMRLISPEMTGFNRPPDWHIIHDPLAIAMMAGLIVKEVPFLFLVALAALPQAKARMLAPIPASLGYGRMAGFLFVVWPNVYSQIRLAIFAVIAYSSSVVDVALILGPTNPAPLAVRLVEWMNDPDLTRRFEASAGALMQLGVTGSALLIWLGAERVASVITRLLFWSGRRYRQDLIVRQIAGTLMVGAALAVFAGLAILALWSFAGFWGFPDAVPRSFTMANWQRHLSGAIDPLITTLLLGGAAALIAVAMTAACLEREARTGRQGGSRALAIVYLPLIVPQASFVFGLQMFFLASGTSATFAALLLVHLVFVLPYVFLALSDAWRAFDIRNAFVAASLGAGENRIFWRVRLPMLLRPLLVSAAIGFAVSVGQYLPTLLVGAGRWPTLTTEAVALAAGGDRRVIGVYAFLQLLLPFAGFALAAAIPAMLHANRRNLRTE